jgi:hypothetical protein
MTLEEQKEIAESFITEIGTYLDYFKGIDVQKREELMNRMDFLMILAAVLPIIMTFISAYAYLLTKQVISLLFSLVDVVPLLLQKITNRR